MALTTRKEREANLIGWDAAKVIRQAQKELADLSDHARRVVEVDGPRNDETPLVAHVMVFEEASAWRMETIQNVFPGQDKPIVVRVPRTNENWLLPEFRWAVKCHMIVCKFCREPEAHKHAQRLQVMIHGRLTLGQARPVAPAGGDDA